MKDTSKVIIGVTLVMVVTLAFVIALILVLLFELYCSLLLRRHKLKNQNNNTQTLNNSNSTTTLTNVSSPSHATQNSLSPPPQNFSNIYSQGVLQAPRNILFPCMENISKEQSNKLHQVIHVQALESLVSSPTLSMSPFTSRAPPPQKKTTHQVNIDEISSSLEEKNHHQLVYISNPIYENEEGKESGVNTPFETPNSSPSHLAKSDSSSDEDGDNNVVAAEIEVCVNSPCYTPPLTPMKKLDAEACTVSLREARSLGTNGSDSIISRSVNGLSSSSSGSPSTSSW
ncbi:hypothetical protein MtrunA17_Chr6g0485411 [Medicago truncatula]|uniref:Transmembrane protein, putative n=1 Tax=Medicago truncatula TaxID=3880 RepID=G8A2J8_MEDTR|nr:uncharacterized protein LOC25496899 [Medicago truncatula]KEH27096.1 transmembrane protein, putative [Medicago truncatula]RHN52886.1 hypothetical protein MtrunA17_Chr6g0485411 [Medicago truncatula]